MYEIIILGLGGMGSAAAAHLAARGRRVLGLEQFTPVHDRGSSHGQSRIIRQAYWEDPAYVPLLLRAYELWADLEKDSNEPLYLRTGGLMVGPHDSELVQGSLRSARAHNLKHELLDANQIVRHFPATAPRKNEVALFELPAGILFPEVCVRAHLKRAAFFGADLRFETEVTSWESTSSGVSVITANGERFEAAQLILCAGAWLRQVAGDLDLPLQVERNVMHWFQPSAQAELLGPDHLPIYIVDRQQRFMLYGFPEVGGAGVKAAFHHSDVFTTPQQLDRVVKQDEIELVRAALAQWLPAAAGSHLTSIVCMYTLTPDLHFIIGRHPDEPNVLIAGGFSGHGFKFCSVVGQVLADLATNGSTKLPVQIFSPTRFSKTKEPG